MAETAESAALLGRTIDNIESVLRHAIAVYKAGDAEAGMRIIADYVAEVDAA